MWFKFAAIAALVFHRSDAVHVLNAASVAHSAPHREKHSAVDYWLRGSAFKMRQKSLQPINKEWKTDAGQHGSVLLGNVAPAASEERQALKPGPKVPAGPPDDFTLLKHRAEGLKADHPANREYK